MRHLAVRGLLRVIVLTGLLNLALAATAFSQPRTQFQQLWESGTPVTLNGELTVIYADDFANHRSELIHSIRDERTGQLFRLRFEGEAPANLRGGRRATVKGRANRNDVYVAGAGGVTVLALDPSATQQTTVVHQNSPTDVVGDQKTLVIVANFSDAVVNPLMPGADCSIQAISDRMFTSPLDRSVDDLYRDMSRTKVSFSGKVVGPYTLTALSTDACANNTWAEETDAVAAAQGDDPAAYARRVYVLPRSTCPAAGLADLGVTPSRAWVFTCDVDHVYAHELGHNLGMQHAATETSEYGDYSDIMGSQGGLMPVNAPHKSQMGWLTDVETTVITQDGEYNVAPLPLDPMLASAPQVLKMQKPASADYYYVSYRHGTGFEANACCGYLDRLSVHRWAGGSNKTYLLAALADGQSFVDPATGFSVTQISHADTFATASVHVPAACGALPPSLTLSPPNQTAPGTPVTYDVALANNDAASCAASTFTLAASLPPGWAGALPASSLQVAPGTTGHTTLTVTPPANIASGVYSLSVGASDPQVAGHTGSASASYSVVLPCNTSAPAIAFAPASQTGLAGATLNYSVTVTNRDSGQCAPASFTISSSVPAGWNTTLSASSVSLAPGATAVVTNTITSAATAAAAVYSVSASAGDGTAAHAASATAIYVVEAPPVDSAAPTAPTSLVGALKRRQVNLSWQASTDNVGVAGYRIWRNGAIVASTTGTSWIDQTVSSGVTYTYSVTAYDAAGNVSASSNGVSVQIGKAGR